MLIEIQHRSDYRRAEERLQGVSNVISLQPRLRQQDNFHPSPVIVTVPTPARRWQYVPIILKNTMPFTVIAEKHNVSQKKKKGKKTFKIRCAEGLEWKGRGWMTDCLKAFYHSGIYVVLALWSCKHFEMPKQFINGCRSWDGDVAFDKESKMFTFIFLFCAVFHLTSWALSQQLEMLLGKLKAHTAGCICNFMFCSLKCTSMSGMWTWHNWHNFSDLVCCCFSSVCTCGWRKFLWMRPRRAEQ